MGAASPEEAERFLAAHPDIVAFDLVLIDPNGLARGKIIRRHELVPIFRSGRHLPGSILGLDINGTDVESTGLVWDDGDADRLAWPIPGSLVELPWTSPKRGEFRVCLYELDGSRMGADPRHALSNQIERFNALGMVPGVAFELEFYLTNDAEGGDGTLSNLRMPLRGQSLPGNQVYSVEALAQLEPFTAELYQAAAVQELPLETMISEYGPGQFELTLRYRVDGLRAADDLVMLKRLVRAIARRHKMRANFMAKPFSGLSGSGMHIHVSLADRSGSNLFADTEGELSSLLLNAIAGLQKTMADSMLVFAPTLNSWRRFAHNSYAPTAPTWGRNNRSVAIRVPAGDPNNRHLEHRSAGVDANPYLVAATVLAGIHLGIEEKLKPDEESVAYGSNTNHHIPRDWWSSIESAEQSAFLKAALSERMLTVFLALRKAEFEKFESTVTAEEYAYYGNTI